MAVLLAVGLCRPDRAPAPNRGRRFTLLEGPVGWASARRSPGTRDPGVACVPPRRPPRSGSWPWSREVPVNVLVEGRGSMPQPSIGPRLAGYGCVKVKVGYPGDVDVVGRARDAVGPAVLLRVDANGAWTSHRRRPPRRRPPATTSSSPSSRWRTHRGPRVCRRRARCRLPADECVRRRRRGACARARRGRRGRPRGAAARRCARRARCRRGGACPAIPTSMMETSVGIVVGSALVVVLDDLPYVAAAYRGRLPADVTCEPLTPSADGGRASGWRPRRRPAPPATWRRSRERLWRAAEVRSVPRAGIVTSAGASRCWWPSGARRRCRSVERPVTSVTGISSSPRRSHREGCAPWPSTWSWWVRRAGLLRRCSSIWAVSVAATRTAVARASASTNGLDTVARSPVRAVRRSRWRASRAPASAMPATPSTSTRRRSTMSGRSSASTRQSRPPIE